jgi:hypothetical protein
MMPTNILKLGLTQLAKLVGGVRQSSPNFISKQLLQMHSKNYLNDANKDTRKINFIGMR